MRIISTYKDYYDHLQGIYGVDTKLVLDRRGDYYSITYKPSIQCVHTLYIGEWMIQGFWNNGQIYFGEDIKQFEKIRFYSSSKKNLKEYWIIPDGKYTNMYCLKQPKYLGDKSPTWKQDCPILFNSGTKFLKFPILKDWNVQKIFSAKEVWNILSEWLGKKIDKNLNKQSEASNNTKILSAGFDLKTSFRKIK